MFDGRWRDTVDRGTGPVGRQLQRFGVTADMLTATGLVSAAATAVAVATGHLHVAIVLLILTGLHDLLDGPVAKAAGTASVRGAFFDSVIDRYSDVAIFFGLLVYYARANRFFYVVMVAFVMTTSVMVSYTRARAESLIPTCKVGFMERPERIVLVIIGALFNHMAPVLWVLSVLSTITVIHRIRFTYTQSTAQEAAAKLSAAG